MTTRPQDLKPPYTLNKIRRMLDSWEGVPAKKLPAEVAIISELYHGLREAGEQAEHLANEVRALEAFMDRLNRLTRQWPNEVARDREREAWAPMHRDMIRTLDRDNREAAKRASVNLQRLAKINGGPTNGNGKQHTGPDQRGSRLVGVG